MKCYFNLSIFTLFSDFKNIEKASVCGKIHRI